MPLKTLQHSKKIGINERESYKIKRVIIPASEKQRIVYVSVNNNDNHFERYKLYFHSIDVENENIKAVVATILQWYLEKQTGYQVTPNIIISFLFGADFIMAIRNKTVDETIKYFSKKLRLNEITENGIGYVTTLFLNINDAIKNYHKLPRGDRVRIGIVNNIDQCTIQIANYENSYLWDESGTGGPYSKYYMAVDNGQIFVPPVSSLPEYATKNIMGLPILKPNLADYSEWKYQIARLALSKPDLYRQTIELFNKGCKEFKPPLRDTIQQLLKLHMNPPYEIAFLPYGPYRSTIR